MKALLAAVWLAISSIAFAQTTFYYSMAPQSAVFPGETALIQNDAFISWGAPGTSFLISMSYTDDANQTISATVLLPFTGANGSIIDQTYTFNVADAITRLSRAPGMNVVSYVYDFDAGYTSFSNPANAGGTIVVDKLTVVNGAVTSLALSATFTEVDPAYGAVKDYIVMVYNDPDYALGDLPVAVPEPATYGALIGAAVLGIVLWKRRKTVSTGDISGS